MEGTFFLSNLLFLIFVISVEARGAAELLPAKMPGHSKLNSQRFQGYPGKKLITCNNKCISINNFFNIIVEQANLDGVVSNSDQLNLEEVIAVNFNQTPLDDVLTSLLGEKGLGWKYLDSTLIVKKILPARRIVTANFENAKVSEIFESIWQEVRVKGYYNEDSLDDKRRITVNMGRVTLDSLLKTIFPDGNITWRYSRETFVLHKKVSPKQTKSRAFRNGKSKAIKNHESFARILTRQLTLSEVIALEKGLKSCIGCSIDNVPDITIAEYPLIDRHPVSDDPFLAQRRPIGDDLPVYTQYFYTPEDSIVRMVIYDWVRIYDSKFSLLEKNKLEEERRAICAEEDVKLDYYQKEYNQIRKAIIADIGRPTKYTAESASWDTPDYSASLNLVFNSADHYIRFKLTRKS